MPTPIDDEQRERRQSSSSTTTTSNIDSSTIQSTSSSCHQHQTPTTQQTNTNDDDLQLLFFLLNNMEPFEEYPGINIGHITVSYNDHVLLLSGFKGYKENSAFYRPSDEIWVYDQIVEKWIKKQCTTESGDDDDMPMERSNACGTIINDHLYMFGGFSEEGNLNTLYRLNLDTLKWKRLRPTGREPLACDKNVCWEYDDRFYSFGGYGPVPRIWSEDFTFQFIFDSSSHWHYVRGWNNQLVCYDPQTNQWQWPPHHGQIPSARAACAASKISNQIYLFGGRMNKERMNDMYRLDLCTMQWTQLQPNDSNHPVRGRSWHTLTPVPYNQYTLVLYGGFSHDNQPLKDCWLFDTRSNVWQQVQLPFERPRFWHSATLSPFGEILVLGGAIEELSGTFHRSAKYNHIFAKDMFALRFQPQSLFRLCLTTIAENIQLSERLFSMLPKCMMEIVVRRCLTANNDKHKKMLDIINTNYINNNNINNSNHESSHNNDNNNNSSNTSTTTIPMEQQDSDDDDDDDDHQNKSNSSSVSSSHSSDDDDEEHSMLIV